MKKVNNKYSRFIPMWLKKLICLFGNIISNIRKKVIPTIKAIYVMTKKLAKENPYMAIGAFLGLIVSILLNQVPVLCWLIGPITTLLIILLGAYYGHCYKSSTNKLGSFFIIFVDYVYHIIVAVRQKDQSGSPG